jgi:hypothetical protein
MKKYLPSSNEVIYNRYYAMEQWLKKTGYLVRIEAEYKSAEITAVPEKIALFFTGAVNWEKANECLLPWIMSGNSLVICINSINNYYDDNNLEEFISSFGIDVEETSFSMDINQNADNVPDFDMTIHLLIGENINHTGDTSILTINDNQGFTRLVEISVGKGKLIVTGTPYFMQNNYLNKKANADLAWKLTGSPAEENNGILFVRSQYNRYRQTSNSMLGKIMRKGNLLPACVSAVLIILLGFWRVIPVFGLVLHEKQKSSRPIIERFSAEVMFLKKYRALNYYLEIYERELQTDIKKEKEKNYKYGKIINKIRSVYDGTDKYKRRIRSLKIRTGKE